MGFEAPLALLGLLAAGIPILVHLMRRRDMREVPLPTLALLERARVRSRRRLRLVDLLLLLCRILLLLMLAIAIAGPYRSERLAWGDGRVASLAIVIDDSMSMARDDGGTTLIERAVDRAREAIASLPSGSEIAIVAAGEPVRVVVPRTVELETARRRLDAMPRTSARATDLPDAVARAVRELGGARHPIRQVLVLSDLARHGRPSDVTWPETGLDVEVERIGPEEATPNRAVTEAIAVPDPTTPGRASVRVEVRAFGGSASPARVALEHRGNVVAETDVEITAGIGRAVLHAPLPEHGDPTGVVRLTPADDLTVDDARGVLLRSPAAARLLVVDGDPQPSRHEDEVGFLSRALDAAPRDEGTIAYRVVDPDSLGAQTLASIDVVVIANAPPPNAAVARRLAELVERGGGLLVTTGDRFDAIGWAARLGEVLPARPRASAPADPPLTLSPAEGAGDFVAEGGLGLGGVTVRRRVLLEPPAEGADVVLSFSDGSPALVVGMHGRGRAAILATTIDDDWTDLPYRPGFLPLVARIVRRLAPGGAMPDRPFSPGSTVAIEPPPGATRMQVIAPDGSEHDLDLPADGAAVSFRETLVPGAYRVRVATRATSLEDDARAAFRVLPPAAESDLSPGQLPEAVRGGLEEEIRGAVVRRSLAPWFFLLVGILAVLEALLRVTSVRGVPIAWWARIRPRRRGQAA